MEPKIYQQKVLDDLAIYLSGLEATGDLRTAFKSYWDNKGATGMEVYKNNVPGVPHVCAKVPTAGGKTFIAVNAIKTIFDSLTARNPERARMVVWLVPSLTILDQTVKALADSEHPYRKRLNQLFKNRVAVYERGDLMMGAGFSFDTVREQLSIVVMSFDSLRAKKKEDRKIFQDNGYLMSFLDGMQNQDSDCLLPEHDPSSLINVIRSLKPVVIVDESHNAESPLSVEMMVNLNPDFILDLTATPKNNSNIFCYVDAMALKRHHMVKLPVIVANQTSREAVIESALILRRQLEAIAISEEKQGGKYIRPIVLFQAQPRTDDDNATFEKIKQKLVALDIPEAEIKIKTAQVNELKGVDLMSRDCQVRYIITVNALKEGWDCPFAYVLASLADKSSPVDVEQILGRVLRMPYVQEHGNDLLNLSYVFTASNKFMDTVQSVVKALNRAGFSANDYRIMGADAGGVEPAQLNKAPSLFDTAATAQSSSANDEPIDGIEVGLISSAWNAADIDVPGGGDASIAGTTAFVESLKVQATEQNRAFEAQAQYAMDEDVPADLKSKMNKHKLKNIFRQDALSLKLPQFFIRVQPEGWFKDSGTLQLFERDELLKDFKLSQADGNISFADVDAQMYRVDLEVQGDNNYAPKPFKMDKAGRSKFNSIILSGSRDSQVRDVTARIAQLIGNMYPITDQEVKKYVQRIVEAMPTEQIRDCLERDVAYVAKIKQKIKGLTIVHGLKAFTDLLDLDRVIVQPAFEFPDSIAPSANAPDFPRSLYGTEASMGDFEGRVIDGIANIDGLLWWHRNLSRGKGFRINGFLNHYPDFILKMKTGKIIAVETKGDDRDNSDSEMKLKLGKLWESRAGRDYRYMMVFDNNPIDGAERLSDALNKIRQF
jgi:type III restriction enzyme